MTLEVKMEDEIVRDYCAVYKRAWVSLESLKPLVEAWKAAKRNTERSDGGWAYEPLLDELEGLI